MACTYRAAYWTDGQGGELVSGGSDEGCSHPADERIDLTEMGGPIRFLCRACGETITLTDGTWSLSGAYRPDDTNGEDAEVVDE